jgi:hypothetical protein
VENIRKSNVFGPVFANAWQQQISNLQAEGAGVVSRILADDLVGEAGLHALTTPCHDGLS